MKSELGAKISMYSRFISSRQWGTSFVFKQVALKKRLDTSKLKYVAIVIMCLTVPASFFKEEGDIREHKSKINTPQNFTADKNFSFDTTTNSSSTSNKSKDQKGKNQKQSVFLGPQVIQPKESVTVPVGTSALAELLTGASNGPVKAKLTQSIVVNGEPLIEEGAILFGEGNSGDERLFINFKKIIGFDGSIISIKAHACDPSDQIVGLKGAKIGQKALQVAGGIGLGFLGGLSEGLESSHNSGGIEVHDNSLRNAMLNGAAHSAIDESKNLLSSAREKKTVIEVPVHTQLTVLFDEVDREQSK